MRWVTTKVSDPKSSTACTMALRNTLYTRSATPYLLRMCVLLLQTSLAWDKFLTTTSQLSYAAKIARPRYLKEVPISWGIP